MVAGSAVGAGEWLFGPAVTAQYGGTFLWLATFSILFQVVYNLEVMRYALYCGEPIFIGFFRTRPGPPVLDALLHDAVPGAHLALHGVERRGAAGRGGARPPAGRRPAARGGASLSEIMVVKVLGFVVFFAAFVPLIFGGKISTMLERLMTFKLVVVLGFLVFVGLFMVSARNAYEIASGFFRVGAVASVPRR